MQNKIAVIAQHAGGRTDPVTYEAISCAVKLCEGETSCIKIIIVGDRVEKIAGEMAEKTGIDVIAIENSQLGLYNAGAYREVLGALFKEMAPEYIVIPHTSTGYDFAPSLAIKLGASCITAVEGVNCDNEKRSFLRTVSNGKLYAEVVSKTKTTVITTQPGAWQAAGKKTEKKGSVETRKTEVIPGKTKALAFKQSDNQGMEMANSDVIVSAGRGIGTKENLSLIEEVAKLFPRSAIGCSRAVCDAGWLEYRHQVGITGTTVSPKLYFAIGISGAIQHTSGIKGAQMVVAVNNDPVARIFNIADYCIVEDLTQFLPVLMEEYKNNYKKPL
jgi:electron transfer flavoprotein alpha subunit